MPQVPATLTVDPGLFFGAHLTSQMFGFVGDGVTNNGPQLQAALSALSTAGGAQLLITPGDYLIDNSAGRLVFTGLAGVHIRMLPGARFVFSSASQGGFKFVSCSRVRIEGWRQKYASLPSHRIDQTGAVDGSSPFYWWQCSDVKLTDVYIENSAAMGARFVDCEWMWLDKWRVTNTMADGCHINNCRHVAVSNYQARHTGDDALSIVDYAAIERRCAWVVLNNITVLGSGASGVAIVNAIDTTLTSFVIDGTDTCGIKIRNDGTLAETIGGWDEAYTVRARVSNGVIRNTGYRPIPLDFTVGSSTYMVQGARMDTLAAFTSGFKVRFRTTGTLPAPLVPDTDYWITETSAVHLKCSTSEGGSPVTVTTLGTGEHYAERGFPDATRNCGILFESLRNPAYLGNSTGTNTIDTYGEIEPGIFGPFAHLFTVGQRVRIVATPPSPLTTKDSYYVVAVPSSTSIRISLTPGGTPITVAAHSANFFVALGLDVPLEADVSSVSISRSVWGAINCEDPDVARHGIIRLNDIHIHDCPSEASAGINIRAKFLSARNIDIRNMGAPGLVLQGCETLRLENVSLTNCSQHSEWASAQLAGSITKCRDVSVSNLKLYDDQETPTSLLMASVSCEDGRATGCEAFIANPPEGFDVPSLASNCFVSNQSESPADEFDWNVDKGLSLVTWAGIPSVSFDPDGAGSEEPYNRKTHTPNPRKRPFDLVFNIEGDLHIAAPSNERNWKPGQEYTVLITQDGSGAHTVTFDEFYKGGAEDWQDVSGVAGKGTMFRFVRANEGNAILLSTEREISLS